MRAGRALVAVACAAALGTGLGFGWRLAGRLAVPAAAAAPSSTVGPDFSAIARRATPAVVNISALQVVEARRSPFFSDPYFGFFRRDSAERRTSLGSGVLISADGYVVTNNHVIERAQQIMVTTSDQRKLRGRLVGSDPATDIAVLRVEDGGAIRPLAWGDSSRAAVGEYVLAIGNPFQLNQTVTMGIISAIGRSNVGIVDYEDFIQTDAAINPGNSGGALVDARGALIGINTAIYSETGGYQGIGFAVPANLARQVVEQIVAHGRVRRAYVGIAGAREIADDRTAAALGLEPGTRGVLIYELLRRSPAERAGLLPGDVVQAIDGRRVTSIAELRHELGALQVGGSLRLQVLRDGRRRQIEIPVEEAGE